MPFQNTNRITFTHIWKYICFWQINNEICNDSGENVYETKRTLRAFRNIVTCAQKKQKQNRAQRQRPTLSYFSLGIQNELMSYFWLYLGAFLFLRSCMFMFSRWCHSDACSLSLLRLFSIRFANEDDKYWRAAGNFLQFLWPYYLSICTGFLLNQDHFVHFINIQYSYWWILLKFYGYSIKIHKKSCLNIQMAYNETFSERFFLESTTNHF